MSERQEDLFQGVVIRDPVEAMQRFLEACRDEEWAELRWSA